VLAAASVGPQAMTGTVSPLLTSLSLSVLPRCTTLGVATARPVLQGYQIPISHIFHQEASRKKLTPAPEHTYTQHTHTHRKPKALHKQQRSDDPYTNLTHTDQAGMIGFITLQKSAPSQMTWQDSNNSRKKKGNSTFAGQKIATCDCPGNHVPRPLDLSAGKARLRGRIAHLREGGG
jgi:hypothetical protein